MINLSISKRSKKHILSSVICTLLISSILPTYAAKPAGVGGGNGGGGTTTGTEFDIPTGAPPSPLFNAQEFTQQVLRFEEFGPQTMPASNAVTEGPSFPRPTSAKHGPDSQALDSFLTHSIFPYPTRLANEVDSNPWKKDIEKFLRRKLDTPPAEGRPSGELWAHQRFDEFAPTTYFKTAQAEARTNLGLRDARQLHQYNQGEFGPGGLYHNTVGAPGFDGTTAGIAVKFHPNMPVQDPNAVFTFDGTFPPKLLSARYGFPVLMRHYNALPIDPSANFGFGLHTITTHEHNGHTPAESDGYAQAFFFPGQFYDYRWPIQLAGYDHINTDASDPRAATPDGNGGTIKLRGDFRETMSTHWFHDHMLDFTAPNVYKGNAAMMNYYSAMDRGNEAINDGVNLRLPSGSALDWGNRDYDVNLLIADKAWDNTGQLFFNIFNLDGFLGDQLLTNWLYKPYMDVRARRYRFRILNGSVSRYIKIAVVTEGGQRVPFHMIANDGNIMEHAIPFSNAELPTQAIAERYDIVVDFSQFAPGTKIYMVNLMEHEDGKGPSTESIPLADILSGAYKAEQTTTSWVNGDPAVGKFLEFRVQAYTGTDLSMNPVDFEPGKQIMVPQPTFTGDELKNALHRTFEFGRSSGTDEMPWTIKTDDGDGLGMDPRRISAAPVAGAAEIWHIINGTGGGWSHPIHVHFEEGKILNRDGNPPPIWEQYARKDVYRIGPEVDSSRSVDIAIRFREFLGTYMEHCHNTQHEDHAMLLRWDIENPGQTILLPTPLPTWDGVTYIDSFALPTFRTGDVEATLEVTATTDTLSADSNETTVKKSVSAASAEMDRGRILASDAELTE